MSAGKLNPNAKPFSFNPNASTWAPGGSFAAPLPTPPAPVEPVKEIPVSTTVTPVVEPPTPPPTKEPAAAIAPEDLSDAENEEVDENDPLYQATLRITNGNKQAAIKMLNDPDSLMQYPEIRAIIESQSAEDDIDVIVETVSEPVASLPTTAPDLPPAAAARTPSAPEEDEVGGESEEKAVVSDGDPREHLNIVFIGHVDAGKSTLSGNILYLTDNVDRRTVERYEKEAKDRNRESWFLAFIMDTNEEERARGKTVEVGRAYFGLQRNRFTIMDAPGHKNYVPNMISGAAQADVGVLVISARRGEFETGFEKGGQTREHALLARILGIRHLVVVINKMDDHTVAWSQERFDECVNKLKPYLKSCGFIIRTDVKFIPISGLNGGNVKNAVSQEVCPWWYQYVSEGTNNTQCLTLLDQLDAITIADRRADAPLRLPVLDRYTERGTMIMGKIEQGTLRVGDRVVVCPNMREGRVEAIQIQDAFVRSARPGENIVFKIGGGISTDDVYKGYVVCPVADPSPVVRMFKAQLTLVDFVEHRPVFSAGYAAILHSNTKEIEVVCRALMSVTNPKTNQVTERPKFARTGDMVECVLEAVEPACFEEFDICSAMGRFCLRDEMKTIALGKITRLKRDL